MDIQSVLDFMRWSEPCTQIIVLAFSVLVLVVASLSIGLTRRTATQRDHLTAFYLALFPVVLLNQHQFVKGDKLYFVGELVSKISELIAAMTVAAVAVIALVRGYRSDYTAEQQPDHKPYKVVIPRRRRR